MAQHARSTSSTLRSSLDPDIIFDPVSRAFSLRLSSCVYVFHIAPNGRLAHLGFHPLPPGRKWPRRLTAPAAYGDLEISHEDLVQRLEITTHGDSLVFDGALKASFPAPPSPRLRHGESVHVPVQDLQLIYACHRVRRNGCPRGNAAVSRDRRPVLCVELRDVAYDLRVTLCYRPSPGHDIIERWLEVDNRTQHAVTFTRLDWATLHLPNGPQELTVCTGVWAREFDTYRHHLIGSGQRMINNRTLNTGSRANPFFLVNAPGAATEENGTVYFGALAWGGAWQIRAETGASGAARIHGGYDEAGLSLALSPGHRHVSPAMLVGCSAEGFGGASRRFHAFARDLVLPQTETVRPVLYNSWEATYFDVTEAGQIKLAHTAASLGVELFVVDDGWFGGRRNDRAGLGDWFASHSQFPHGLLPLAREIHRLGMKFGLWVEPEMVNPDSDLYRRHPDWVLHWPGRSRREIRNQLVLDLGRQEVVEYLFERLDALVRENRVDFFKWDMNRAVTEVGSVAGGEIFQRHIEAVYEIMDRLRARHRRLRIESCSGGGSRIDYGILQRTDQVWTSDNTDAHDRLAIQEGYSLAYPLRAMMCWVTHEDNHQTGRHSPLDLRFDVAMRGSLGLGAAIDRLDEAELAAYRRKIIFYKKIRETVQNGNLYRLHPMDPRTGASVWLTVSADRSTAVYSAVFVDQPIGLTPARPILRGLNPLKLYRVSDETGRVLGIFPAVQLLTLGLPHDLHRPNVGRSSRSQTLCLEAQVKH